MRTLHIVFLATLMLAFCFGRKVVDLSDDESDSSSTEDSEENTEMNEKMKNKMMGGIKKMQKGSVGQPDHNVGKALTKMENGRTGRRNADQMGSYMEGDILQTNVFNPRKTPLWPGGVVPFVIEGRFDETHLHYIRKAMTTIEHYTCINFEPNRGQRDYIAIMSSDTGCWSAVGRSGGRQELNLQTPGCINYNGIGIPIHELLHALGLPHEHNRRDREGYVRIFWNNIQPQHTHNFDIKPFDGLGVKYDFDSIMHYDRFAFSKNDRPTISIMSEREHKIGQRKNLSFGDINKINRLYGCPNKNSNTMISRRAPIRPSTTFRHATNRFNNVRFAANSFQNSRRY